MKRLTVIVIVSLICSVSTDPRSGLGFRLKTENSCACPWETLTLECNVIGGRGGSTVFNLYIIQGNSTICDKNEIVLLHNRYNTSNGTLNHTLSCNDGAILTGRSLRAEDNCYTSQLQIKVRYDLIGKLITCSHDNGTTVKLVGNYSVPLFDMIEPLPPPSDISWERLGAEQLMFSWSPVVSNCVSISYNILDSHCGVCPNSTVDTNITCNNVSTRHLSMCMLAVQTIVCGNISGKWSTRVYVLENGTGHSLSISIGVIIAITISCVVLLLGMALVILGLTKKRKPSQPTVKVSVGAQVQIDQQSESEAEVNPQPKPTFHCDQTNETRGYTLCQSDYDQITVSNNNYNHLDYTHRRDLAKLSNAMFRGLNTLDRQSIITGCVRVEDEYLDLETLLAKLQGRVSTKWFQFGLAIGVPKEILEQLKIYPVEDCLVELLDYWLRYHPDQPTWKELADAIEDIQDYELASSILKVYEKS